MAKTKEYKFELPGLTLSMQIVDDVESLVSDPEDDDKIPYWAELWPASQGLASYIWAEIDCRGVTLLELGAGLALPGLVAACKGAVVTLTDFQPEALTLIRENAERNGINGVIVELADWRQFPIKDQFDWIIGSDILYNPGLTPYVAPILAANRKPQGQLLFSHPGRAVTLDFIGKQQQLLGLQEERTVVSVHLDQPFFPDYQIDIHRLYRSK
jgi:predicted nicotinamide N-methyase